eukprot:scaffold58077_cov47-Attheya_sp.AAC.3
MARRYWRQTNTTDSLAKPPQDGAFRSRRRDDVDVYPTYCCWGSISHCQHHGGLCAAKDNQRKYSIIRVFRSRLVATVSRLSYRQ